MKIKKVTAACLAIAGVMTIGSAAAYLYPNSVNDFRYYSDASMTEQVGGERYECDYTHQSWGTKTPWREHNHWPCPEQP